jgi:predicted AlkP superfamily pyrophosphatase or phosphodiesterase
MSNKVIMILCDGMRPDFVLSSKNPYVAEFLSSSVYAMSAQTTMPSVTLPCHTSLFLSVPSERHGILTNTWTPQVRPIKGLVEVLNAAGKSCAFVCDWDPLRDLARPETLSFAYFANGGALGYDYTLPKMVARAAEILNGEAPDFMFVYLGLPDAWGHEFGFTSDKYAESVSLVWDGIKTIAGAASPDYGAIVLADHGGHGRSHGEDIPEDMTIPIILRGEMFGNADISGNVNIMDVAPTVAEALGVKPDAAWEGRSLYRA